MLDPGLIFSLHKFLSHDFCLSALWFGMLLSLLYHHLLLIFKDFNIIFIAKVNSLTIIMSLYSCLEHKSSEYSVKT